MKRVFPTIERFTKLSTSSEIRHAKQGLVIAQMHLDDFSDYMTTPSGEQEVSEIIQISRIEKYLSTELTLAGNLLALRITGHLGYNAMITFEPDGKYSIENNHRIKIKLEDVKAKFPQVESDIECCRTLIEMHNLSSTFVKKAVNNPEIRSDILRNRLQKIKDELDTKIADEFDLSLVHELF